MNQALAAKHALWQQLIADGVDTVFGNPGTFEQGLLDALRDYPQVRYVMGLQEAAVLAMGTNYARIGRRCGVVQLHARVGFGNAAGALQDAVRGQTPLLVLCGENATDWEAFDGFLAGDITRLAIPAAKAAIKITSSEHFLNLLRRAWVAANTPPRGPVIVTFPMDLLERPVRGAALPTVLPVERSMPDAEMIETLARVLADARKPLLLVGDALSWSDAHAEALKLAALLDAPLHGVGMTMVGDLLGNPRFGGLIRHVHGETVANITRRHDVIVAVGVTLGAEMFPQPDCNYLSPGTRLLQIDPSPLEIGKNVVPTWALTTDPRATLAALCEALSARGLTAKSPPVQPPPLQFQPDAERLSPQAMMNVLATAIPRNALVVDESMTASDFLREALRRRNDVFYQSCLSPGLGSGWPAGVSAKLLHPDRPVLSVSADGSAMYVAVALWTAAQQKLDVTFLTVNNHAYQILKYNIDDYWKWTHQPPKSHPPMMDLCPPEIRFDLLAESMGVRGHRAFDEATLRAALETTANVPGPHLIDVVVDEG